MKPCQYGCSKPGGRTEPAFVIKAIVHRADGFMDWGEVSMTWMYFSPVMKEYNRVQQKLLLFDLGTKANKAKYCKILETRGGLCTGMDDT
eukprot:10982330-Ditylum_brightwellii.AAC.1